MSDESEPVSGRRGSSESGCTELTPLSESGVAVGLEDVPAVEVAIRTHGTHAVKAAAKNAEAGHEG